MSAASETFGIYIQQNKEGGDRFVLIVMTSLVFHPVTFSSINEWIFF